MKQTALASDRWFDVLLETDTAQAAVMTLAPGQSTGGPDNKHAKGDQWVYVVEGSGRATVDGDLVALDTGDLLCIEAGETHEIENSGDEPLETLNLYVPPAY
jgi:mannose-6-phosphate isomerase-like protein (cupin superfamily)